MRDANRKITFATSPIVTESSPVTRTTASAKVVMNGATSIDITYSDGSVVNVPSVDGYAAILKQTLRGEASTSPVLILMWTVNL